jgi:DUF4097 and DUF4098 domain-containing protein YvlB
MRTRGSIVGPLILITIGVLFLVRTAWPAFSVFDFLSVYWPYLLIFWGLLQIVEISIRAARGAAMPSNGITAGGWFLVLLICLVGFGMYEVRGPQSWWRRVSFDQGMEWFGEAHDFPIAQQTRTAGKTPRIVIEDFRGSAKISGADTDVVQLSGHKTIRAMKDADARRADQETPVEMIEQGDRVVIRINQGKSTGRVRVSNDLDITVPKGSSLQASGESGDFDVSNLDGDVRINSDNAGVRLQDIGGNVSVETRRGDLVRCINVKGSVDLRGHNSDVELEKIAGPVSINGAYSGTITLRELAKPLHIDNFNTTLSLQKVSGQVTMDRGTFSAQGVAGPAELSTHATDVEIGGFTDALNISVDKGDVSLRPSAASVSRMRVRTRSGNIDLALPESAKFELTASTDRGEIENDFGAPLKVENVGRGARAVGAVGTGPDLNLTTDRGSITIRKGTAVEMQAGRSGTDEETSEPAPAPRVPAPPKPPKPAPPQNAPAVEL